MGEGGEIPGSGGETTAAWFSVPVWAVNKELGAWGPGGGESSNQAARADKGGVYR